MADNRGNIRAIIQAGQQIATTLANMRQQKWMFAIEKAKMNREERLIAQQRQDKIEAANIKFGREQRQQQEEIRKQREGNLVDLMKSLKLTDAQKKEALEEGFFTGAAEKRVTKHVTTGGTGRTLSAKDALFYEMRSDPVKFNKKMEKIKADSPESYNLIMKVLRTPSVFDFLNIGGQQQEPPPPGLQ